MEQIIEFRIPLKPVGKMKMRYMSRLDSRTGKHRVFNFKDGKQAAREKDLLSFIRPYQPKELWTGPLKLCVDIVFEIPDNWPKWKQELLGFTETQNPNIWPTRKPDGDNMVEMIQQVMIGVIYRDDAQICIYEVKKSFGLEEGWQIKIQQIPGFRHDIKRNGNIDNKQLF
jgi:Holliday junction resolvase RusA-like endonuclease